MSRTETVSLRTTARCLWIRAPLWRFSLMSATLLTLLFVLFPPAPHQVDNTASQPPSAPAAYIPQSALRTDLPQPPSPPSPTLPQTADLSLATPESAANDAIKEETGVDPSVLGRLYSDSIQVNNFKIPLLGDHWAMLSAAKLNTPKSYGVIYFLGKIAHKKLVGGLMITAARTKPAVPSGENVHWSNQRAFFKSDECASGATAQIQSCWMVHHWFGAWWHKWGDRSVKMPNIERAAAGYMDAHGITYPQDLVALRLIRTEKWGVVTVVYLFSPETEHIATTEALSFSDSDWDEGNIRRYPDKLAYVEKIKQLGSELWPKFRAAFAAGE